MTSTEGREKARVLLDDSIFKYDTACKEGGNLFRMEAKRNMEKSLRNFLNYSKTDHPFDLEIVRQAKKRLGTI